MAQDRNEKPLTETPSEIELAELAVELAVAGGRLAVRRREAGFAVDTKSSATDVVTDVDRAVEDHLRAEIARRRPRDSVLGEERGDAREVASPVRWLIDPIDGTVNYMLGLPVFSVSVAAEVGGHVVAGCVTNPVTGLVFRAAAGHGSYLGEVRLTGPRSVPLTEAVIATGFGYDRELRARQGRVVGELLGRVGNIRRLGSAALDLCALAAGWVDGYYEGPLNEWDFAAGALIAAEAGVALSGLRGRPVGAAGMVAGCHPDRAADFFGLLEKLGAAGPS